MFGLAFIGCGKMAETAAGELNKSGVGKIVAVFNRTPSRAEDFVKKFGGKVYGTAEEAICAPGVDCVYIATPHNNHAEYSELAINSGVPVLCEKPSAVNFSQAEEVFSLAKAKKVYFAEAMWTWHNPVSVKVKSWINAGAIGKIKRVIASFAYPICKMSQNPRLTTPCLAGGALLDIGIYPVRYVSELFGEPKKIECSGDVNGVDYEENIKLFYDDFCAEIYVSMKRLRGERLIIEGEKGKISVPCYHKAKKAVLKAESKETFKNDSLLYALQFKHTAEDIAAGRLFSPFNPPEKTLETIKILDECRRQMNIVYPFEK